MRCRWLMGVLLCCSLSLSAKVTFPTVLADNMVLQQNEKVNLWGKATPNKVVKITPSWSNVEYKVTADQAGKWLVKVQTPAAGGPYEIEFNDGETVTLKNILIGEVWFCSGQSNMEMPMRGFGGQPVEGALDYVIKAKKSTPIRMYTTVNKISKTPMDDVPGTWKEHDPEGVSSCSATAYFFARYLQEVLEVPIGLVISNWGGSSVEAWMSREAMNDFKDEFDLSYLDNDKASGKNDNQTPCYLYNAKLHPLINYTIKGAIWYQGESNAGNPEQYTRLFPAFVKDIRKSFKQGDFPFYYVQIAPYAYGKENEVGSALLRESQLKCMDLIPNSGMAVTMDTGQIYIIHPRKKKEAGERLAYWALAKTYNIPGVPCESPVYDSFAVEDGKAVVSFKTKHGLCTHSTWQVGNVEIAGEDKVFHEATAYIRGNKLYAECKEVPNPVALRYGFKNYTEATLFNDYDIPVSSFRTDNW